MRSHVLSLIGAAACVACAPADKPADSTSAATKTDTLVTANLDAKPRPSAPDSTAKPSAPTSGWTVTLHGIGPISAGMTLKEAAAASDGKLVLKGAGPMGCAYLPLSGLAGAGLLVDKGVVNRVDVDSAGTATAEGVRVGDTEASVKSVYRGRVTTTPHKYTQGGHYLTVRGAAAADRAYRMVFETDGRVVTRYRAGRAPAVEYVERCG